MKNGQTNLSRGILKAIVWETRENGDTPTFRYSVYIPLNSPGYPDGKIVAGGSLGLRVDSRKQGIDACEEAMESYLSEVAQ